MRAYDSEPVNQAQVWLCPRPLSRIPTKKNRTLPLENVKPVRVTRLWPNCISQNLSFVRGGSEVHMTKPRFLEI